MLRNILYIVLLCFFMIDAATYTVAKDGTGQFDNIRAALNHVEANDVILILDKAEYNSRVFIDGSHDDSYDGITLKSADPTASEKPAIVWNDRSNVYPDLQHEHTVNYDENGALCLKEVKNVTIEGIRIDGNSDEEGYFIFGENDIWGAEAHLQHGNGALAMKDCYGITVRNCDIGNAYIGINIKGRNEGGIYANANPHDVEPWDVVPLSGFGKSGHHIFEYNRIHNNSFGMYFESIWDLGSIIRYNLFYEYHHASDSLAEEVYNLTAEGPNQPGGVIMGKDHMLSPIAVYNNTFWHNASILIGNWRQGRQHLFFNNIVSSPYRYLDDDPVFLYGSGNSNTPVSDLHMEQTYANRINNSVYAAQAYDPSSQDPVLIYEDVEVDGASQGALISTYPGRDVRWLETESLFQSTDPASSSFLEPDWSNSDVQTYIVDQGWEDMDIRDPDGSPADLGAYSEGGGQIRDVAVITPLAPVKVDEVDGNTIATVVFDLSLRGEGNFVNPELQYVRFLRNIEFEQNAFGARSGTSIQESDLVEMDITDKSVEMGYNELEFQIQERDTSEIYAFFEMSIQGTGANGNTVTSGVGFPLYRRLDFVLDVTVIDESGELVSEIDVGEEYFLHIEAYDIDGTYYSDTLTKNNVTLDSDGPFYSRLEEESKTPMNIREIYQVFESECYFTKVPENKRDIVKVTALWQHPSLEGYYRSFYGISQSLEINPGPPAEIEFVNPPSVSEGVDPYKLDYGDTLGCAVQVTDEFGNKVDESVGLQLETTDPFIGDIEGAMEGVIDVTTDTSGRAEFNSFITYGATGQEYSLIATASNYGFSDTAVVSVNSSLDHLWIFYDDAGNYDEGAEIRDTSGNRVPVIIWASKDGTSPLLHRDSVLVEITDLTVNAVDSTESIDYDAIDFYASENAEDTLIDNRFMLMSGMDTVWISSEYPVENGKIRVEAVEDSSIVSGGYAERGNIYFEYPPVAIDSANFYSDNSTGTV
ncbi:MAG: hypothetical protein ACOCSE_03110, partial [Chitinivibrionales bacterium]